MDSIARGVEAAACTILKHLGQTFGSAEVDYESFDGLHNFIIQQDRTRFRVQFTDQALLRKSSHEIEETIHKVVEQVLCATRARVLKRAA